MRDFLCMFAKSKTRHQVREWQSATFSLINFLAQIARVPHLCPPRCDDTPGDFRRAGGEIRDENASLVGIT
jgi:hypothetical protein